MKRKYVQILGTIANHFWGPRHGGKGGEGVSYHLDVYYYFSLLQDG
jgi:hypothetical protein